MKVAGAAELVMQADEDTPIISIIHTSYCADTHAGVLHIFLPVSLTRVARFRPTLN